MKSPATQLHWSISFALNPESYYAVHRLFLNTDRGYLCRTTWPPFDERIHSLIRLLLRTACRGRSIPSDIGGSGSHRRPPTIVLKD